MTYLDLDFCEGAQRRYLFLLGFDAEELSDSRHILLQLDDEAGHDRRDVVPLVRGVTNLGVDEGILNLLPF